MQASVKGFVHDQRGIKSTKDFMKRVLCFTPSGYRISSRATQEEIDDTKYEMRRLVENNAIEKKIKRLNIVSASNCESAATEISLLRFDSLPFCSTC